MEKMMSKTKPHSESRLARFVTKRVLELAPKKSQAEIAVAAGFTSINMIAMVKSGAAKLAIDRVPALARALETDPKYLMLLTLEQHGLETTSAAIVDVFGAIVTDHEVAWLEAIRDASGHSDPALTSRGRAAIRGIFNK
jgi:hypothetical protein